MNDQGYAVGVDRIRTVLEELRERLPDGLLAASATEGTSAEAIGLEDVLITEIGGRSVGRTMSSYCEAVAGVESGDARPVKLIAGPRRVERTVRVVFE